MAQKDNLRDSWRSSPPGNGWQVAAHACVVQANAALTEARQRDASQQTVSDLASELPRVEQLVEADALAACRLAETISYKARGLASGWEAIAWEIRTYLLCQHVGGDLYLLALTRSGQIAGVHGPEPRWQWLSREGRPVGQVDGRAFEQATWDFLDTEYWARQDGWRVLAWYEYDGDYNRNE